MDSIDYYERYAASYYDNTSELSMEEQLDRFIALLPENAEVLDLGCGSGRDTIYLEENGCQVTPMDGSRQMCLLAEINTDMEVLHMTFDEMEFQEVFDGIWACASLLHVPEEEMDRIMVRVTSALVPGGILYMSFKYGEGEEIRDHRLYHNYTEETAKEMLSHEPELELLEMWQSEDVRGNGGLWLNILARRAGAEKEDD